MNISINYDSVEKRWSVNVYSEERWLDFCDSEVSLSDALTRTHDTFLAVKTIEALDECLGI